MRLPPAFARPCRPGQRWHPSPDNPGREFTPFILVGADETITTPPGSPPTSSSGFSTRRWICRCPGHAREARVGAVSRQRIVSAKPRRSDGRPAPVALARSDQENLASASQAIGRPVSVERALRCTRRCVTHSVLLSKRTLLTSGHDSGGFAFYGAYTWDGTRLSPIVCRGPGIDAYHQQILIAREPPSLRPAAWLL